MTRSPSCRTDDPAEILRQLLARYPLPPSWRTPELFSDVTTVAGVRVHAVGCCSEHPSGASVTGSAASLAGPDTARAYFELLERSAVMDAIRRDAVHAVRLRDGTWGGRLSAAEIFPQSPEPEVWRYARSNGVALGLDHAEACTRAEWELIERDRILRSWHGETRPAAVQEPLAVAALPPALVEVYEFRACLFPPGDDDCAPDGAAVAGVFGFPRQERAPLIFGFGARAGAGDALGAAGRECIQRLAFLWGEDIPAGDPPFAPTAEFHQEYFLQPRRHQTLQHWLSHGRHDAARPVPRAPLASARGRGFADLTPAALRGKIAIVKALPRAELPLCFGRAARSGATGSCTDFHPIP
jgi:ribosomal protein S12 methylthiotransferase accessory factor YcaO